MDNTVCHLLGLLNSPIYVRALVQSAWTYLPLCICAAGAVILIYYHLRHHLLLANVRENKDVIATPPSTSVIICARNEEENLRKNLPHFLNQDHPKYEVIVVDDGSSDNTAKVVNDLCRSCTHLRLLQIDDSLKQSKGKKHALTLGIEEATHSHLLFSDADCRPASRQWARILSMAMTEEIVLGYGKYEKQPGFLNRIIRYDTFQAACLYLSKAVSGTAYMGVGRNMGYRRHVYDRAGGYSNQLHIPAGDDDLFVNAQASRGSTTICSTLKAHTISDAEQSWSAWFKQKTRHIGVSSHYTSDSKRWLITYHLGQGMFYVGLIAGLLVWQRPLLLLTFFFIKTLIQLLIVRPIARQLEEKDILCLIPILEPMLLMYNIIIALRTSRSNGIQWK